MKTGMVQIYTGEGKGKTTAALGLALRAAGHGLRVHIFQFLKGESRISGEFLALERSPLPISWRRFHDQITPLFEEACDEGRLRKSLRAAMEEVREAMRTQKADILILDEINVALDNGWLALEDVLDLIERRPSEMELVLTGRGASEALMEVADIVTEMREIKHPFRLGKDARRGIEF